MQMRPADGDETAFPSTTPHKVSVLAWPTDEHCLDDWHDETGLESAQSFLLGMAALEIATAVELSLTSCLLDDERAFFHYLSEHLQGNTRLPHL